MVREIGQTQHLFRRDVADRNRHADPVQPGLLLRKDTDMGMRNFGFRISDFGFLKDRHPQQFVAEQFLRLFQIFFQRPALEQMFQARLFPVATIAVGDVNPDDRNQDFQQFFRSNEDAEIASEGFVAGRAAQVEVKIDSGRNGVGDQVVGSQGRTV